MQDISRSYSFCISDTLCPLTWGLYLVDPHFPRDFFVCVFSEALLSEKAIVRISPLGRCTLSPQQSFNMFSKWAMNLLNHIYICLCLFWVVNTFTWFLKIKTVMSHTVQRFSVTSIPLYPFLLTSHKGSTFFYALPKVFLCISNR